MFQHIFFLPTTFHQVYEVYISVSINYEGFIYIKPRPGMNLAFYIKLWLTQKVWIFMVEIVAYSFSFTQCDCEKRFRNQKKSLCQCRKYFWHWECHHEAVLRQGFGATKLGLGNSFWLTPASIGSASIIEKLHLAEVLLYRDIEIYLIEGRQADVSVLLQLRALPHRNQS